MTLLEPDEPQPVHVERADSPSPVVFACHHAACGKQGDVIDLWAALHGQSLRAAALDLARTFGLEPAPGTGPEKRNG